MTVPKPSLAISILNWNGLALTQKCVQSLLAGNLLPDKIIILDNGSKQNEAEILKPQFQAQSNLIKIIRSEKNLGFAGGNNFVLDYLQQHGTYDYIALLNQDAVVDQNCFREIINYLEANAEVAVAGPLVLNIDHSVQSCGADISLYTGKITSRYQGQIADDLLIQPTLVDCVIGNCFVMRQTAWQKIGKLDEKFFAYYEEADWCLRAKTFSLTCAVVPTAKITHAKSDSFRTYLILRNMIWFQKRYARFDQLLFFWFYFWCYFIFERLKKGSALVDIWRAAKDGWLNRNLGQP